MNETIQLINHASISIKLSKDTYLLSDPWYEGSAFDNGWKLLYENNDESILQILGKINYIFISHEHPDHFSIIFFKKYSQYIKEKKITIIFQQTLDKRVENFLTKKLELDLIILERNKTKELAGQKITLIDCGTIDSGIIVETNKTYHININDCDFTSAQLKKIKGILQNNKKIVIYMQFSYAAYRSDDEWLKRASIYKLEKLLEIYKYFKADLLVPFASFIYFSSPENFRLNKYMNNVKTTSNFLNQNKINYCILNPDQSEIDIEDLINDQNVRDTVNANSINFWDEKFINIKPSEDKFEKLEISDDLKKNFLLRIKKKNTLFLMYLLRCFSFKYFFGDIIIHVSDNRETYILNFFKILRNDNLARSEIDIEMKSKRFIFLLKEPYGLDTLSVNGCFDSLKKDGFENFIRSVGFVVLNQVNMGINVRDLISSKIINRIIDILMRLIKRRS